MAQTAAAPVNDYVQALNTYGPRTAATMQRSQYLAQALQSLQQSAHDNMRTPVALGSNLLAEALLSRKYGASNADLAQAIQSDRTDQSAPSMAWLASQGGGGGGAPNALPPIGGGLGGPNPPPPAGQIPNGAGAAPNPAPGQNPSPTPGSPTVSTNGLPVPPPTALPATAAQAQAPAPSPIVLRAVLGEAGGDPAGQRPVYASILKRAQESGLTPEQVVQAPGQYEGLNAPWLAKIKDPTPLFQQASANLSGVQPGQFDSFYSPKAQAALGRPAPSWAQGAGTNVGGNTFYQTGYKAPPGMVAAGGQPTYAPQGQPGPLQVTNAPQGTPTPSPQPSAPAGMSPPAAGAGAGPAASVPAGPAQPQTSPIMHAPVTPEEIAYGRSLLASPRTYQQGIAYVEGLRQRQAAPLEPKLQIAGDRAIYSDPYGRGAPTVQQIQGLPVEAKAMMQGDGRGGYAPTPGTGYGAPAPMPGVAGVFQKGPGGKVEKVGDTTYSAPGVTPGVSGVTQVGPDGKVSVVGQAPLDPSKIMELQSKLYDSDEYKKFAEGRSSLVGFRNAVGMGNNGVLDTAAVDSYLRSINPGMGARNTTVQMFLNHLGIPQEVQGAVLGATGNGYLTPQTLNQMDHVMQAYVAAHAGEVQAIHKGHVAFASQYGVPESALGEDMGTVPAAISVNVPRMRPGTGSAQQTAQTASGSVGAMVAIPRVGEVRKGYAYKGGDPSDPASWVKAQ